VEIFVPERRLERKLGDGTAHRADYSRYENRTRRQEKTLWPNASVASIEFAVN